jgi:hypothetical protein
MTTLYHVTIRGRLASILLRGVDPSYSQGKLRACWYCSKDMRGWAVLHVCRRHNCRLEDVAVIECRLNTADVKRSAHAGLYHSKEITSPAQLGRVTGWEEVAVSPLED